MNTPQNTASVERCVAWIVDRDGMSYGDERERLRYYEAHSAMLTAQTYVMPIVAAVVIAAVGVPAIVPVLVVTSIPTLLGLGGVAFLSRQRVSLATNVFRRPSRAAAYAVAYLALPVSVFFTARKSFGRTGLAAGLVVGIVVALGLLRLAMRRTRDAI